MHMKRHQGDLIESDTIKIKVLVTLGDGEFHTPSELASQFHTSSKTIQRNAAFLALMGLVTVETRVAKQKITYLKVTQSGIETLKRIRAAKP